jgi:UDP-N-acetylmuramoylalanine--D-glutamate ligase
LNVYRNRRVTVMGLGAFGGGEGVVRFLSDRGARVTVTDLKSEAELAATLSRLADCRIEALHLDGHQEDDFREADLIVVNPAVPRTCPWLAVAREVGVPLTSEMNLFIEHNRARVLAVTGSIGKSTTTALAHAMLEAAGLRAWLGGNIGRSLLPLVDDIREDDWVVLELSSFQLTDLDRLRFHPNVAVVTNLRPNHLDWHASLDEYRTAKQTILRWQQSDDVAILNADDPDVAIWPVNARTIWFGTDQTVAGAGLSAAREAPESSTESVAVHGGTLRAATRDSNITIDLRSTFPLPGDHHALNAAAAAAAAVAIGVDEPAIRSALASFTGLPHRLQFIGEHRGRRFYDDSKATTPEAALAALVAFNEPVILLAGGYDKHVDLAPFAARIAERTKAVALMGQTATTLEHLIRDHAARLAATGQGIAPPARNIAPNFADAVDWAIQQSAPGDVILLSPGCASYGWFSNYVARGQAFADLIRAWERNHGSNG